ncbi:MAG: hypothetical protein AAGB22_07620 [Bacteroidota bacterium]
MGSCRKAQLNSETITSEDSALAERLYNDLLNVVEEAVNYSDAQGDSLEVGGYFIGPCARINIFPAWPDPTFPKSITISFEEFGCLGRDNRVRNGDIQLTVTGDYRNPGTMVQVNTSNYVVGDFRVAGSHTILVEGRNELNRIQYTVVTDHGEVVTPDGDIINWDASRIREWISGETTSLARNGVGGIRDDVYLLHGAGTGINRDGRDFTVEITRPLVVGTDCRWAVSGSLSIRPDDLRRRSFDFGGGECDRLANVEIGDDNHEIRLR